MGRNTSLSFESWPDTTKEYNFDEGVNKVYQEIYSIVGNAPCDW